MPYVCKFCIAQRGLKASELDQHARDYETIAITDDADFQRQMIARLRAVLA